MGGMKCNTDTGFLFYTGDIKGGYHSMLIHFLYSMQKIQELMAINCKAVNFSMQKIKQFFLVLTNLF